MEASYAPDLRPSSLRPDLLLEHLEAAVLCLGYSVEFRYVSAPVWVVLEGQIPIPTFNLSFARRRLNKPQELERLGRCIHGHWRRLRLP